MQRQISENWNKLYQCATQPLAELTELNINTFNHWSKNVSHWDEFTHIGKPDEFINVHLKLANLGQTEALSYVKKAGDIWIKALEKMNDVCKDITDNITTKTTEVIRSSHREKETA